MHIFMPFQFACTNMLSYGSLGPTYTTLSAMRACVHWVFIESRSGICNIKIAMFLACSTVPRTYGICVCD